MEGHLKVGGEGFLGIQAASLPGVSSSKMRARLACIFISRRVKSLQFPATTGCSASNSAKMTRWVENSGTGIWQGARFCNNH